MAAHQHIPANNPQGPPGKAAYPRQQATTEPQTRRWTPCCAPWQAPGRGRVPSHSSPGGPPCTPVNHPCESHQGTGRDSGPPPQALAGHLSLPLNPIGAPVGPQCSSGLPLASPIRPLVTAVDHPPLRAPAGPLAWLWTPPLRLCGPLVVALYLPVHKPWQAPGSCVGPPLRAPVGLWSLLLIPPCKPQWGPGAPLPPPPLESRQGTGHDGGSPLCKPWLATGRYH